MQKYESDFLFGIRKIFGICMRVCLAICLAISAIEILCISFYYTNITGSFAEAHKIILMHFDVAFELILTRLQGFKV